MRTIKMPGFVLALVLGVCMFIYGGYDDSPGGQLLGLVAAGFGTVGIIKALREKKP